MVSNLGNLISRDCFVGEQQLDRPPVIQTLVKHHSPG